MNNLQVVYDKFTSLIDNQDNEPEHLKIKTVAFNEDAEEVTVKLS